MKGMHFMIQKRKDFGPDGWETVCPGADFDIVKADGANHFTLMVSTPKHQRIVVTLQQANNNTQTKQHVRHVSDLIDRVME